jgi:hypothetical protein
MFAGREWQRKTTISFLVVSPETVLENDEYFQIEMGGDNKLHFN